MPLEPKRSFVMSLAICYCMRIKYILSLQNISNENYILPCSMIYELLNEINLVLYLVLKIVCSL